MANFGNGVAQVCYPKVTNLEVWLLCDLPQAVY
jgi:hypothetical protein